jgi:3-oxoacyl-[acyl-carrier protein] reductase
MMDYAGNATKADEVVAEINTACGQAMAVQADVVNAADVYRLFKKQRTVSVEFNVVANCASIMTFTIYFFILPNYLMPFVLGILVSDSNRS